MVATENTTLDLDFQAEMIFNLKVQKLSTQRFLQLTPVSV